jgi:Concanavalin A-like lectin/glucanases superfamily/Domain of unknown function (DUF2341)
MSGFEHTEHVRGCVLGLFVVGCGFGPLPANGVPGTDGAGSDAAGSDMPDAVGPEWMYKRQLTIDNSTLGPLTAFPLLVVLTPTRIRYTATGADLRFADDAGTPLPYELDTWNPAGTSFVWVRVPAIADHGMTSVWMYYDNPNATDAQMPTAVWDDHYVGVWHLGDAHDSTGKNASTNVGGVATTGQIGPALAFGTAQYVDTKSTTFLSTWTIEAWIDPATSSHLVTPGGTSVIARFPNYLILWDCANATYCHTVLFNDDNPTTHFTSYTASAATWSHVAGTYDGTGVRAYVDGITGGPAATTATPAATADTAKIGIRNDLVGSFPGAIDEARISDIARSADYMKATTRAALDTYVMFGDELPN